jgi:plastocyanin
MKYKVLLLILDVIAISCENDSTSDLTTETPTTPESTSYNFGWSQSGDSIDQQLTIEVGDTVTWTWGSGTHNLEQIGDISEPGFAEGYFSSGHVYSHTFTTVGAHDYLCSPHPNTMYGTITVTE